MNSTIKLMHRVGKKDESVTFYDIIISFGILSTDSANSKFTSKLLFFIHFPPSEVEQFSLGLLVWGK